MAETLLREYEVMPPADLGEYVPSQDTSELQATLEKEGWITGIKDGDLVASMRAPEGPYWSVTRRYDQNGRLRSTMGRDLDHQWTDTTYRYYDLSGQLVQAQGFRALDNSDGTMPQTLYDVTSGQE